jgi:DNA adenine methylase
VTIKPPFPYFGGKQTLGDRIIRLLPEHRHYVEPYGGSLSLLLAKPRVRFETVNDLDGDLMHFWRVLRTRPDELESACGLTPHSRAEHDAAKEAHKQQPVADEVERARQTWVQLTQGRSGKRGAVGWRYYVNPASSTYSMPQYLAAYVARFGPIVERLHGVSLECRPALEVVERYGAHSEVLLMVDPPYVRSTRAGVGYRHEMDDDDHRELAKMLHGCASTVVLCGYPSNLYDEELFPDWNRLALPASTGNGGEWRDRTEVLWSNRPLGQQMDLFDLDEVGGAA